MIKKVLIVDDEIHAQQVLKGMLEENFPTVKVVGTVGNVPEAVKAISALKPDIVFLDIEMPVYSGLELVDFFPKNNIDFHIVFVTAYNQYALDAFQLSATDYIIKPVQVDALKRAITKIERFQKQDLEVLTNNLNTEKVKKILLTEGNSKKIVALDEIIYLKADGSYCNFILTDGSRVYVTKRLGDFEYLTTHSFFRSHRSSMINLHHVKSISNADGGSIIMSNEEDLPISKDKRDELATLIKQFLI